MFRFRIVAISPLILAAACAGQSSTPPPGDPGDPGTNPTPPQQVITTEQLATQLGVAIMAAEPSGAPRLLRTIVPRPSPAGAAPAAAAVAHIAALAPLWVQQSQPMALAEVGTQPLRNGATIIRLAQHVDGVPVDGGELRVLLHIDGSLAAIGGTLLPNAAAPAFASSPPDALGHALDHPFGAATP